MKNEATSLSRSLSGRALIAVLALALVSAARWIPPEVVTLREQCEWGDPGAQAMLAESYARGEWGVETDYAKAIEWYKAAAKAGHPVALYGLGRMIENGHGTKKNTELAAKCYAKAFKALKEDAETADPRWQCNLAVCYMYGLGTKTNKPEAARWFRKSADRGYARAQYNLGLCCQDGTGISRSRRRAAKWFRKAADQEHAGAQFCLARCYREGWGVRKNDKKAIEWFRKAADQEYAKAQYCLGVCYSEGRGAPADKKEAVKWFRKAADQGLAVAQFNLGLCYDYGDGVKKNSEEARKWIRLAALQGDRNALNALTRRGWALVPEEPAAESDQP